MKHKKQAYEHIERTTKWNTVRGNTPDTLNMQLEFDMLEEELKEVATYNSEANLVKELLDLQFVLLGTLGKLGLSPAQIVEGYEIVLQSNETKSATKDAKGKIIKPDDFISPEAQLQKVLDER